MGIGNQYKIGSSAKSLRSWKVPPDDMHTYSVAGTTPTPTYPHTHTHPHTYIYTYIYTTMCHQVPVITFLIQPHYLFLLNIYTYIINTKKLGITTMIVLFICTDVGVDSQSILNSRLCNLLVPVNSKLFKDMQTCVQLRCSETVAVEWSQAQNWLSYNSLVLIYNSIVLI